MEKVTFPNGLRVLMEKQDHVRSVSFGFWIKSGSAYETAAENGVSHFMEHMAFKGTAEKSARQIAEEMDAIGGQMNAYTAKEYTCYYGRTLTEHLEKAFSILAGMVTRPKLDPGDIQTEKSVIMEEISMTEDMPEDRVVFGVLTFLGSAMLLTGVLEPLLKKIPPAAGLAVSAVLFALTYHLDERWLGFGGLRLALPDAWYIS